MRLRTAGFLLAALLAAPSASAAGAPGGRGELKAESRERRTPAQALLQQLARVGGEVAAVTLLEYLWVALGKQRSDVDVSAPAPPSSPVHREPDSSAGSGSSAGGAGSGWTFPWRTLAGFLAGLSVGVAPKALGGAAGVRGRGLPLGPDELRKVQEFEGKLHTVVEECKAAKWEVQLLQEQNKSMRDTIFRLGGS